MGITNSTLSINDFKNQIFGAVALGLLPKLDTKLVFDGNTGNLNSLPKIEGVMKLAFLNYYGKNVDHDQMVDKYFSEYLLNDPERLKLFYRALTESLFSVKVFQKFSTNDKSGNTDGATVNNIEVSQEETNESKTDITREQSNMLRFKNQVRNQKDELDEQNQEHETELNKPSLRLKKLTGGNKSRTTIEDRMDFAKIQEQRLKKQFQEKEHERKEYLFREQEQKLKQRDLELKLEREKQYRLEQEKQNKELEIELEREKHKKELDSERKRIKQELETVHNSQKERLERLIKEKKKKESEKVLNQKNGHTDEMRQSVINEVKQEKVSIKENQQPEKVSTKEVHQFESEKVSTKEIRQPEKVSTKGAQSEKISTTKEIKSKLSDDKVIKEIKEIKMQSDDKTSMQSKKNMTIDPTVSSIPTKLSVNPPLPPKTLKAKTDEFMLDTNLSIKDEDIEKIRIKKINKKDTNVESGTTSDMKLKNEKATDYKVKPKITSVSELQDRIKQIKKRDDDNDTMDGTYEQQSFDE